jgi:Histidine kinase-like ATPase domain
VTAEPPHRFALTVPAEAGYVATIRLFAAAVARAAGADEEVVEDVKLAVSELSTAIVVGEDHDAVEVTAILDGTTLEFVVGPLLPGDLVDGAIDPVDIVLALFPETTRDLEGSTVHLPVPLAPS